MQSIFTKLSILFCFLFLMPGLYAQEDAPLVHADQMPYFPGCDDFKIGSDEKRQCSNEHLVGFISNNIIYPDNAKNENLEGTVYISFVIDKAGNVTQPSIIRDIGGGCGQAALDVLHKMPTWLPGKHEDEFVNVKLNLPVNFTFKATENQFSDEYSISWGTLQGSKVKKDALSKISSHDPIIRDELGNEVHVTELILVVNKSGKIKEAKSNGSINSDMKKLIAKSKEGSLVLLTATIQEEGQFYKVNREFEIVQ